MYQMKWYLHWIIESWKTFLWILIPLENCVLNGSKGTPELPNRKTGIGSLTLQISIVPFRSILLRRIKKNMRIMNAYWTLYYNVLKAIFLVPHSLNVHGKITLFCWYDPSNIHLVLLTRYRCHLLSLCIEEIHVFLIIYLWVFSLCFQ